MSALEQEALSKKNQIDEESKTFVGIMAVTQAKCSVNLVDSTILLNNMAILPPEALSAMIKVAQECLKFQNMLRDLNMKRVELKAIVIGLECIENRLEESKKPSHYHGPHAAEKEILEGAFKKRAKN